MEGQPPVGGDEPAPSTELRTFLIADVRGYTAYTREHGDEAAAELAGAFAATVRDVVGDHGGFLLELRGDEALVVFVSARQALRAAVELQDRFADSGLARPVGIGLDAGEAVSVEGGYRGGALNLAARLCSRAGPGEVIASEAVIHLAAHVDGLAYVEPRSLRLKGYEDVVRAVEVVSADRAPRKRLAGKVRRARRTIAAHRRATSVAVALALVIAIIAVLLPAILGPGGSALASLRPGMALIDADTGDLRAFVGHAAVQEPAEVIYADGSFWVLNLSPISFVRIDPSGKIRTEIASPFDDVGYFAVDGNTLWVTRFDGSEVSKVDISLGREVDRFTISDEPGTAGTAGIAVGAGSLWIARPDDSDGSGRVGMLLRVDPESGQVEHRFPAQYGVFSIGFADGQVWTNGNGTSRIDPATNTVAARTDASGAYVSAGGGYGWTADESKGEVYKIDSSGTVAASYRTGAGARALSFSEGVLWVGNQDAGTVTGIDAVTGRRHTYRFEHPLQSIAAGSGVVLVQMNVGRTYEDRIEALSGDVARLLVQPYQLLNESGDPATVWSFVGFQVEYATCARLLNYPDSEAPDGTRLEPEVAASMPDVSADGRTYTFQVRDGFAFSPPSNEPVTAETFRYSIERALSPRVDGPGTMFISDISGEDAFLAGKAEHIAGLRAQGDTLTITLDEPSGDFLRRLAMPFFCPVPTDSPIVPGGAVRGAVRGVGGGQTVPSAGPYYIADGFNGEYTILKRNPNYSGSRPHGLDAIALREGVDPGEAVGRVRDGGWDGITNLYDPLLDIGGQLAGRWGPQSQVAADDQRYFPTPWQHTGFIAFNAGRPTFADPEIRKAASLALDRRALAAVYGQLPTDQLLPPGMPGWVERDLYATESDTAAASGLGDGRKRSAVMGIFPDCSACVQEAQIVQANLAAIGINVQIREFDNPWDAAHRGAAIDLLDSGAQLDYADPAQFLLSMFTEAVPPAWLPEGVHREVEHLVALADPQRTARATALADRLATEEVPVAALGVGVIGEFFSPRLGCRVFPPQGYGVDLAALCLEPGG